MPKGSREGVDLGETGGKSGNWRNGRMGNCRRDVLNERRTNKEADT